MKKIALVGIIAILTTIGLTGCDWFQPAEDSGLQEVVDDVTPADDTETPAEAEPFAYVNGEYEFMLEFPVNWGTVETNVETEMYQTTLTLNSNEAKELNLKLYLTHKDELDYDFVQDAPMELLAETDKYMYYVPVNQGLDILEAQGEDVTEEKAIEADRQAIYKTFTLLKKGTYFANTESEGQLMYRDDDEIKNFFITNSEDGYTGLNLGSYDEAVENLGCPDFSGYATFEVTDVDDENLTATLVSVVEWYPPHCDNPNEGGGGVAVEE